MDYKVLFHNSLRNNGNRLKGVSEGTVNHWVGQADFMGENYLLRRKGSQPLNRQSLHTDRKSKSAYTKHRSTDCNIKPKVHYENKQLWVH